jgi:hypothetical protein
MRTRQYRRHQKSRNRQRAIRLLNIFDACGFGGLAESPRMVHLYEKQRKPCSCYMCRGEKYRDTRHRVTQTSDTGAPN